MSVEKKLSDLKISLFLFLGFLVFIGVSKFGFHELWKDEWQAWFVASDLSIGEMLSFLNYEGHPALWYIYLKGLSIFEFLFSAHPEMLIQIGHYLLVIASSYFFFLKFKMHWVLKLLIAFSYFMAFEYGVVNRGYILVILFSFWITFLIQQESSKKLLAVLVILLCQTEVYGVLFAGGFVFYLLLSSFRTHNQWVVSIKENSINLGALLFGLTLFILTVFPRGNREDFSRAYLPSLFDGDTMLDAFQGLFANNFLIGSIPDTSANGWITLGIILSLFVVAGIIFLFWKKKNLLLTFGITFLVFYLFAVNIYNGGIRQWGMLFVFFICLVELAQFTELNKKKYALIPVLVFSIFQWVHSARSFYTDYTQPFTNAEMTGLFLKENVPENVPIIVANKFESTPVIGYTDRPFYELPSGNTFTHFKWLEKVYLTTEAELKLFAQFKKVNGIIYLSPTPINKKRFPNMKEWKSFNSPNYKRENYYIYSLQF